MIEEVETRLLKRIKTLEQKLLSVQNQLEFMPSTTELRTATIIRESSGPTSLMVKQISEGCYLKRSGKTIIGSASPSGVIVELSANRTNSTFSYADVVDLTFAVAANKDYFAEFFLSWSRSGFAVLDLAVNGPAAPVLLNGRFEGNDSAPTFIAYDIATYDAGGATFNSITSHLAGSFLFRNGVNAGTFALRFRRSGGTSVTILQGSVMRYVQLN